MSTERSSTSRNLPIFLQNVRCHQLPKRQPHSETTKECNKWFYKDVHVLTAVRLNGDYDEYEVCRPCVNWDDEGHRKHLGRPLHKKGCWRISPRCNPFEVLSKWTPSFAWMFAKTTTFLSRVIAGVLSIWKYHIQLGRVYYFKYLSVKINGHLKADLL